MRALLVPLLAAAALLPAARGKISALKVELDESVGRLSLGFDDGEGALLETLPVQVTAGGITYSSATGTGTGTGTAAGTAPLLHLEAVRKSDGSDALGDFSATTLAWRTGSGVPFETDVLQYADGQTLVFAQRWPEGALNTSVGSPNKASSQWPAWTVAPAHYEAVRRKHGLEFVDYFIQLGIGLLSFNDRFMESSAASNLGYATHEFGGERAGPVVLFDQAQEWTLAMSPLSNVMATNVVALDVREGGVLALGLLGSLASVPKGFELRSVLSLCPGSITLSVRRLGDLMLKFHGTKAARAEARKADLSLSHLGYATDHGAFYYYLTDVLPNGTKLSYQDTLLGVHAYAKEAGIPYRYVQLDSWWYTRGKGGGVKRWEARPDVFADGLRSLVDKTDWPLFLHNRYWSPDNDYARSGQYAFATEDPPGAFAIPLEQRFWDDLMRNHSAQGMFVYEQDWLYNEFENLPGLTLADPLLGREWLRQMGRAAQASGVAIQYCMPLPRMVLQAAEIASVTQVRAGDDYHPGNTESCRFPYCLYYISTTSLLLWALDLAPAKDVYWTSAHQPHGPYPDDVREPHAEMLSAVAIYSTGPVQLGDAIGRTDTDIVALMVTPEGRLLQPSRPATAIDQCFVDAAFGGSLPDQGIGQTLSTKGAKICAVSSSHTEVGGRKWAHVLVVLSQGEVVLRPSMLPADVDIDIDVDTDVSYLAYFGYGAPGNFTLAGAFSQDSPMRIPRSGASDFGLWHAAPVVGGLALLGEAAKLVPVSVARFAAVEFAERAVTVQLRGAPGERVVVTFATKSRGWEVRGNANVRGEEGTEGEWRTSDVEGVIRSDGTATMTFRASQGRAGRPHQVDT